MGELQLSEDQHKLFTETFAAFDTEGGGLLSKPHFESELGLRWILLVSTSE